MLYSLKSFRKSSSQFKTTYNEAYMYETECKHGKFSEEIRGGANQLLFAKIMLNSKLPQNLVA